MELDRPTHLLAATLIERPPAVLTLRGLFGNDHPVELDVGCGKGLFLAEAAATRPGHNFLGVELSAKYARLSASRVEKRGLANARVVHDDARRLVSQSLAPESLAAAHVYFPDPWWKKRHKKRRVFTDEFVAALARAIRPGGMLHTATDVEEYANTMRAVMARCAAFVEAPDDASANSDDPDLALTNFERKYKREGRPIFRAHYRRV